MNQAAWTRNALNYEFRDPDLLSQALTHKSANGRNNERLEFLGDAVLDAVISELVYDRKPDASEGSLSRLRSSLVKDTSLADLAADLGVGEQLNLGPGEKKTGGHRRASILADALEALFAAIYLDSGYLAAREVIMQVFSSRIDALPDATDLRDPKTRLQELLQSRQMQLPAYSVEGTSGKAHEQSFEVSCRISEPDVRTTGEGKSRRDAEQQAAERMLLLLDEVNSK